MSVLNNLTLANQTTPYYALAGESAKNWYQFPSLNGQVLLNDSSGTEVLKAIGGDLFFNNELLAKAGDIQDIADWSLYPALATVELAGQSLTQANDISSVSVHATTATISGVVEAGTLATVAGPYLPGNVKTQTVTASGLVGAGSVSASGNIQGASLTTTGGLDMTNTSITRASSVGISNAGFAPYGSLTSPDGVALTWNGASITTGAGGNASQWSNFPALTNVNMAGFNLNAAGTVTATTGNITNISTSTITASTSDLNISTPANNIVVSSYANLSETAGANLNLTVDRGASILLPANMTLTAQNGLGGNVVINSEGGYSVAGQQVGYGAITLNAFGATNQAFGLGGKIDINAYSAAFGEYGGATSRCSMSAATIALSAGAAPALPGLAGSMNIFGNGAVSIVSSLVPPILPQIPETIYMYGLAGVRLESPAGVQSLSDTYIGNLYPLSGSDLILQGRSLPDGYVRIRDCAEMTLTEGATLQANTIQAVGSTTDPVLIKNIVTRNISSDNTGNVNITGFNNPIGTDYYVDIDMANTLSFSPSASGAITGVQSINGAAWPPPTGDASLWSQYPATSIIDVSGFGLKNVGDLSGVVQINGVAYPPPSESVGNWSTYPAIQDVDMSGFRLTDVASIDLSYNSTITSAGRITLVSPDRVTISSGSFYGALLDMSGGDIGRVVNILSAPETNLSITSTGGINITSVDDTVNITGGLGTTLTDPSGVTIIGPFLDLRGADLVDVKNINGDAAETVTINSFVDIGLEAANDVYIEAQAGTATVNGTTNVNINSSAGDITLNTTAEVTIPTGQLNMNLNKIVNVAPGSNPDDAVNYTQLTFRDNTEFYVSAQGSDISNNGSILAPFRTIQAAITAAELISSASSICNINVASGNYTENLTFNKGYVTLTGTLQSQTGNETCEITGSINIICVGANDTFNRQVTFQGFNITHGSGQSTTDTSTASHTVAFQDCKIFANSVFFNSSSAAPDMRFYLTNVEVNQTNAAFGGNCITTNVGLVEFERLDLNLSANAFGVVIGGTSVLNRCSLSTFDNSNTAAILRPLLTISSSTTSTHSLGNVAFAFSSVVAKTNTNALYINSGINTAIIALNCVFTLGGTASSTNNCVGYSGVGSPTIAGVNNTSLSVNVLLPQTTSVQSGIAQVAYIDINPPGLATYSSTADQAIAVSGTPQALTYNTIQFNQGTTLLANSRVYANAQGNYALSYSVELQHSGAGPTQTATIFLKKNGTTIANTGRQWSINSANFQIAAMAEFVVALNAGDYVEVFFSGDTSLSANATAAAGALPAVPSVVFNIKCFR
jgi:hypothetical protein